MNKNLSIGQMAQKCGCKVQTLRYYEEIGLIPPPVRNSGNQRVYDDAHQKRLNFIRHARHLGFSLDQIRQILSLTDTPDQPCDQINAIAQQHLDDVTSKIIRLQAMQKELRRMVRECSADNVADCRIVEILSNHSLCHSDH